jgi:serine/threonine-protein kinase
MPSPPPVAPPAARVGTLIAQRYRLTALLGEGGIGTVYAADDVVLRMPVALKLLKPEYSTEPEVLARFEREADAMIALAHENVVQALAFGRTAEGEMCMVMELVEGETLRSVLRRVRPVPVPDALEITQQIASALVRAHSLGIVHRDLKPENVMVTRRADGRPQCKVLDFGMARVLCGSYTGEAPLTRRGQVFGTPEYMAPEQAMGQPVDAHADQYALGVILYEMLAGRRPFAAATPLDLLQLQIHQRPTPLHELAPHVPPPLAATVARMLAKRPSERFPTVLALTEALASLARAHAGPVAPPGPEGAAGPRRWWQLFSSPGPRRG